MPIEIICCPPPPKRILIPRDLDAKIGNEKDPKFAIRVEGLKPKNLGGGGTLAVGGGYLYVQYFCYLP